jgi:hypothetical protein
MTFFLPMEPMEPMERYANPCQRGIIASRNERHAVGKFIG